MKITLAAVAATAAAGLIDGPAGPLYVAVGSFSSGSVMAALVWSFWDEDRP